MKKVLGFFAVIVLSFVFVCPAFAGSQGMGTLTRDLTEDPLHYNLSSGAYGLMQVWDIASSSTTSSTSAFLDASFIGSDSDGLGNTVSGEWDPLNISLVTASSQTQNPGVEKNESLSGLSAMFAFSGVDELSLSYTYAFDGTTDSDGGAIRGGMQAEVFYYDDSGLRVKMYSDYDSSALEFRTKMPWFWDDNPDAIMDKDGSVDLTYESLDGEAHDWEVQYDFSFYTADSGPLAEIPDEPIDSEVPEPTTMVMFSLGLLGLLRKKFKK